MPKNKHPNKKSAPNKSVIIKKALENIRGELLDLTARNPLLNSKYSRGKKFVQIVDELPGAIADKLLNGNTFKFSPIPGLKPRALKAWQIDNNREREPNVEELAHIADIDLSIELPETTRKPLAKRHTDSKLQTKYEVKELEKRLSNIKNTADSCIQETGLNTLYLVLGHLDWEEAKSSKDKRSAPLFTIPVSLNKGALDPKSQTYVYTLEHSGEDLIANASLEARLKRDFGYCLPSLPEDNDLESYFKKIEASIKSKFPEWQVRRTATLTFLNFGKLLMYQDLDPERWPKEKSLAKNKLVQSIITGASFEERSSEQQDNTNFAEEYDIDSIDEVHRDFPLVDSADSSQHSAIIDAVNGENLVIEGPPGAGKSQTITNLIAAAIESGKTVLFVSEKMAALEVVKTRLDKLGLGDFCLELHSHATKKMGVLESLKSRMELQQPSNVAELNSVISTNNHQRQKLSKHADLMNKQWLRTGLSIHSIFSASAREAQRLPIELSKPAETASIKRKWTEKEREKCYESVKTLHAAMSRLLTDKGDNIRQHPWYGITSPNLNVTDKDHACSLLKSWNSSLLEIQSIVPKFLEGSSELNAKSTAQLRDLMSEIDSLPESIANISWQGLAWALKSKKNTLRLAELLEQNKSITELLDFTNPPLSWGQLDQVGELGSTKLFKKLESANFDALYQIGLFPKLSKHLDTLASFAKDTLPFLEEFGEANSGNAPKSLHSEVITLQDIDFISEAIKLIDNSSDVVLKNRHTNLLDPEILDELKAILSVVKKLQQQNSTLTNTFNLSTQFTPYELRNLAKTLSSHGIVGRIFNSEYKNAKRATLSILKNGKADFDLKNISLLLSNLATHNESAEQLEKSIQQLVHKPSILSDWKRCSVKDFQTIIKYHTWILDNLTSTDKGLFSEISISDFGEWLCSSNVKNVKQLLAFKKVELTENYKLAQDSISQIREHLNDAPSNITAATLLTDLISSDGPVSHLKEISIEGSALLEHALTNEQVTISTAKTVSNTLSKAMESTDLVRSELSKLKKECFASSLEASVEGINNSLRVVDVTLHWARQISAIAEPNKNLLKLKFQSIRSDSDFSELQKWVQICKELLKTEAIEQSTFVERVSLDSDSWIDGDSQIEKIIDRNQFALKFPDEFNNFALLLRSQTSFETQTSKKLSHVIMHSGCSEEEALSATRYFIKNSLSKQIIKSLPELQSFQGVEHEQLQKDYKKTDNHLLTLQRDRIKCNALQRSIPNGHRGSKVAEYTEYCLVQHEANKQKRHIPIRQLLNRAGAAIQGLKPCFMMGPRSVAQYLEPGKLEFDLLVIDEASQLKPSEALGATARAKQLVVVGDPKQLPPTTFFDRNSSDEEDDEELALSASESILEAALPIFTARRLRWHYRSRHESLIAFSNQNFYNNNLLLFPSPTKVSETLGIKHFHIEQGCFKGQQNPIEAEVIAKRLETLLTEDYTTSVGIATMNMKQRELIEAYIEKLAKQNALFDRAISKNKASPESYFVKNLETVQGDERDIILISCTYGPGEPGGRVFQRFGPINSDSGWRRLNVLFTRSRCRMEVYTSIQSSDILADSGSRGVRAFKAFLHYSESGNLHVPEATGNPADSDFETAVAELLSQNGYECDFQVGVAGFFIDLAVKHPSNPGKYILAVECDGATYHSSKSARDRDCLRQDILESLGWNIIRIWSTDWFNNPQGAIKPVLRELKNLT